MAEEAQGPITEAAPSIGGGVNEGGEGSSIQKGCERREGMSRGRRKEGGKEAAPAFQLLICPHLPGESVATAHTWKTYNLFQHKRECLNSAETKMHKNSSGGVGGETSYL